MQSQGADNEGIARSSTRRNYKSVEPISHQAQHEYCYDRLETKRPKHLPLGKSGDAKAEFMDIFLDLFKGIPVHLPARNVPEALHESLKRAGQNG